MSIPLLDVKAHIAPLKTELMAKIESILDSGMFILGSEVTALEEELAAYSHTKYAIGVSSGTDALLMALMALDLKPGDEVITTPYTFFATAGCIARTGATPVFVDILEQTFNINPALIEQKINSRTRAIIVVHLYGQCADMIAINAIATRHGIPVIEDAAQAIGSEDATGKRAGSMGLCGCLSFFPSKNLGCCGDGGAIITSDTAFRDKLINLRNHGMNPKYYHSIIGGNFRIDALQAGILRVKLPHLDYWTTLRQSHAQYYRDQFTKRGLTSIITLPTITSGRHIFNQFIIRVPNRDGLIEHLRQLQIGCEIYYPLSLHQQHCFAYLGYKAGDFPHAEKAAAETLALPVYPELTQDQLDIVIDAVARFCRS